MATSASPLAEKRPSEPASAHGEASGSWRLVPHCCRNCFGRILSRPHAGETLYRCSNCGMEKLSTRPESICACGTALRTGKNAGLRCVPNPEPRPECPSEYVVEEASGGAKMP
jgi:hypothetical protein